MFSSMSKILIIIDYPYQQQHLFLDFQMIRFTTKMNDKMIWITKQALLEALDLSHVSDSLLTG